MCPQNISDRPGSAPSITPTTLVRPGTTSCTVDVEPRTPHVFGDRVGNRTFAGSARHQRRIDRIDRDELAQQRDAGIAHRASIILRGPPSPHAATAGLAIAA